MSGPQPAAMHISEARERTVVVLLFGPNCAGKSTVGTAVAGMLRRCAFIEVDVLYHMVVAGLVTYDGRLSPAQQSEEYRQQCRPSVENAVRLAHGFAEYGFSSVIDGLEDECRAGSDWAESNFPAFTVANVAVVCNEIELTRRWSGRGWGNGLPQVVRDSLEWYRDNASRFDIVVDATDDPAEVNASRVACELQRRFLQTEP